MFNNSIKHLAMNVCNGFIIDSNKTYISLIYERGFVTIK